MSADRTVVLPPHLQDAKVATDELVGAFGKQEAAAALVGRSQSRVSAWGLVNTDSFIPLDAIDALEARTVDLPGWPHITDWLCRRRGGTFLQLPKLSGGGCWGRMVAKLAKEAGNITSGICGDLADDNDVSPAEARRRLHGARELVRIAVELEAALKARAEEE